MAEPDDEVTVETDEEIENVGHNFDYKAKNVEPEGISESLFTQIINIVTDNGWYIIICIIALYYIWTKLKPRLERFQTEHLRSVESALHHKNPDDVLTRQEAMDAARRKLQEQYDLKAEEYARKQKEKEERQREEKLKDWERHERGLGYRSKTKVPEAETVPQPGQTKTKPSKPKLRPEYNPLMGDTGGVCFRPGRKGAGGGG